MKRLPSIVLLLLTCAPALVAELNFTFPRTRTFADVGHTEGGGRGRSESRGMAPEDAFDLMPFRAGASLGYASTRSWRAYCTNDTRAEPSGSAARTASRPAGDRAISARASRLWEARLRSASSMSRRASSN